MDKQFTLTKNEREIMELLWSVDRPLSRSEIIELSPDRSWKSSSIHILLNQLLEKGAIIVDGFVKTGKNYGRTFSASISAADYQIMQFKQSAGYLQSKSSAITGLVSLLVEDDGVDAETLDELDAILKERRKHLK